MIRENLRDRIHPATVESYQFSEAEPVACEGIYPITEKLLARLILRLR
jgi:hypothetical protein